MDRRAEEILEHAQMVLVGIGGELSPFVEQEGTDEWAQYRRSRAYAELPADHEVLQALCRLREVIGKRPYFVVTLNTDDLIYRAGFEPEYIVAPCGSMEKLQCDRHIVDAAQIRDRVLAAPPKQLEKIAVCPVCGERLHFHIIETEGYLESGYLPQWEAYRQWLGSTRNRELAILELGVGFQYPQVIRWPFEKLAYYNKKAVLIRVNSQFPQVEAEIAEKSVSIRENPVSALQGMRNCV